MEGGMYCNVLQFVFMATSPVRVVLLLPFKMDIQNILAW